MKSTKVTSLPELPGRIREHTAECFTRLDAEDRQYGCSCSAYDVLTEADVRRIVREETPSDADFLRMVREEIARVLGGLGR